MSRLKVEIKITDTTEPYAVIYTGEITDEIQKLVSNLNTSKDFITASINQKITVLKPEEIYMVRVENNKIVIYTEKQKYYSNSRLYEFEKQLGKSFMRISKATIVNLKYIDYVEPSFNSVMDLYLKNGCKDYISRTYLPSFKKYLGI